MGLTFLLTLINLLGKIKCFLITLIQSSILYHQRSSRITFARTLISQIISGAYNVVLKQIGKCCLNQIFGVGSSFSKRSVAFTKMIY
jgi:hypothetical protein